MPNELPTMRANPLQIKMRQSTYIVVTPKIMKTSDELREYSVEKRNCYFSDERYLRFFKEYTENNCEAECEANASLANCGCVTPNIPVEDSGVQICGPNKFTCYFQQSELLMSNEIKGCDCLPGCNSITYETEASVFDLNTSKYDDIRNEYVILNLRTIF
jgi:acid-sensing ion channel, other